MLSLYQYHRPLVRLRTSKTVSDLCNGLEKCKDTGSPNPLPGIFQPVRYHIKNPEDLHSVIFSCNMARRNTNGYLCLCHESRSRAISFSRPRNFSSILKLSILSRSLVSLVKGVVLLFLLVWCWFLEPGVQRSLEAVLRIHDIVVWIRIRGSMPLTHGSGSGSFYFHHWPSRCQQ